MSDTPMLELLAYVMRDPEWAASEITILQRELAAAAERIAELETLLREVLRQGCEYHTKKYALLQMDHALIQEIADAIGVAREEEGK